MSGIIIASALSLVIMGFAAIDPISASDDIGIPSEAMAGSASAKTAILVESC